MATKVTWWSLHKFPAMDVAEELALRDAEMLRRITSEEIRNGAWMDDAKKHELAPNVLAMIRTFNQLAQVVPTEVLEEETTQQRAKVISAFIKIAKKCYELKNFNSLNAILAGLQCTPLYRLKKTWKEVPSRRRKQMDYLTTLMSEEHNWRLYTTELANLVSANTTCIVFLGVFLTYVVKYDSFHKLRKSSQGSSPPLDMRRRKSSLYGNYTVLEAVTMRHRLYNLNRSYGCTTLSTSPVGGVGESWETENGKGEEERRGDKQEKEVVDGEVEKEKEEEKEEEEEEGGEKESILRILSEPMDGECISILSEDSTLVESLTAQSDVTSATSYDGDSLLSPDDEDLMWSKEVIEEVEHRMNTRIVPHLKRGRSLEQLLEVCQLDDDSTYLLYSRSHSMPKLMPSSSQRAEQHQTDHGDMGPGNEVESTVLTNGESISAEGVVNSSIGDGEDVLHVRQHNIIDTGGINEWGSPPRNNYYAESRKITTISLQQTISPAVNSSYHNGHPENRTSKISFTMPHPRKRFTASDDLHVLQLQLARDEVTKKPSTMLSQYQVLSLGYGLRFNRRPHISRLLSKCRPKSDTLLYRRSYKVEM